MSHWCPGPTTTPPNLLLADIGSPLDDPPTTLNRSRTGPPPAVSPPPTASRAVDAKRALAAECTAANGFGVSGEFEVGA